MSTYALVRLCKTGVERLKQLALPAVAIALFGCAATHQIKDIDAPLEGKALVFGSVEVLEDGKPKTWGMKWTGVGTFNLLILPPGVPTLIVEYSSQRNSTAGYL